jgi:transposase
VVQAIAKARRCQFSKNKDLERITRSRLRGKKNRVLRLYAKAPSRSHVICFDEFGPMELRPLSGHCWARKRHPQRVRATYNKKAGTEQFIAFYDVHKDVLEGVIHKRKTSRDLLQAWKRLRACYPKNDRIYLIMDNLSSHRHKTLVDYARKYNMKLVSTPTYASWLNLIEAQFGPLKNFCLNNSDDRSHFDRRRRIYRYLTIRNRDKASTKCYLSIFRRY